MLRLAGCGCCLKGFFHANRDRGGPYGPPPFGMMYPPGPRIRGQGGFHYDGPRSFGPRPSVYVRHGMRGFGGRHMDGPRPRHYRDPPHGFGPPLHNSFDSVGGRRAPTMHRDSPSISDLVQHTSSTCDGMLLISFLTNNHNNNSNTIIIFNI